MSTDYEQRSHDVSIDSLTQAIFTVNRHAKTAPNPKFLYHLKRKALEKLVEEGKAKKLGLHFSNNPKNSKQQSDVLVSAGHYYFHMPPSKEDFKSLPHLGTLNESYRNPKAQLSLGKAKSILQNYVGIREEDGNATKPAFNRNPRQAFQKPIFKRLGESYHT